MSHTNGKEGPAHSSPASAAQRTSRRGERLQQSRRLDWRFLLPDPSLRHVALLGDDDPDLVHALRCYGGTLSLLDLGWRFPAGQEPRFDLVVLRSPRLGDADHAAKLVEPGGCLYWEIERRGRRTWSSWLEPWRLATQKRSLGRLVRLRAYLGRLGFHHIHFQWHRPSFQAAVEIVPLEDQTILKHVLAGESGSFSGESDRLFARLMHRAGLLQDLVSCVSIVASRGSSGGEEA